MAQNQSPAFFAVALLLFAAAAPLAIAQQPPPALPIVGSLLNALQIKGTLCCTPTGNCPGGPPLSLVPVTAVCNIGGVNVTVGQTLTSATGDFSLNLGNLLNTLLGPLSAVVGGTLPCTVKVDLPLSAAVCPALNLTNSALNGVLTIISVVPSVVNGITGIVAVRFRIISVGGSVTV